MNTGCFTNLHELPPGTPSFVQQLRKSGYRTCAVGKTHMEIHAYDSDLCAEKHRTFMDSLGWDEIYEISGNGMLKTGIKCSYTQYLKKHGMFDEVLKFYRNWHYFMDKDRKGSPNFFPHEWSLPDEFQETAFVGQKAFDWLQSRDRSQPFYLHVGFAGPHSPIEPHPDFMDLYRDAEETQPWGAASSPEWLPAGRRGYRAMISQIDHYVGRIHHCIAEQGELENTIFVYTADHGEMAGDHGKFGKTVFFEGGVRVPLIISGSGCKSQQKSSALVEIIDMGKTLCEMCRAEPHALDQGQSLVPILSGESQSHRDTVYCEMGCDKMIYDGQYKLMWGDPASDKRKLGRLHLDKPINIAPSPCRLYDLQEDPHELNDLAKSESHRGILQNMMEKMLIRLNQNAQPQPNKDRGEYRPL